MRALRLSSLFVLAACSSEPVVAPDASAPTDAKSDTPSIGFPDAGTDADADLLGDGCPPMGCPTAVPSGGAPCSGRFDCEYGDSPLSTCDTVATCNGSAWQVVVGSGDAGWCVPSSECPLMLTDALDAGSCSSSAICHYLDGTCACSNGAWQCVRPTNPSCPSMRPRIGTPCSGSLTCAYGQYCSTTLFGDIVTCTCGTWQQAGAPCPPPPPKP